jgi:hypothetical protein
VAKKQQKSKAITLTFRPFLATFAIFQNWAKKSLNFSSIFSDFCHFSSVGKKQQNGKAIALTFRPFLATFAIFHKWAKNSKEVSL